MIFKALLAFVLPVVATHIWGSADRWKATGVIPGEFNEGVGKPVKSDEPGFRMFIGWNKFVAIILGAFALMAFGSLLFDLTRLL